MCVVLVGSIDRVPTEAMFWKASLIFGKNVHFFLFIIIFLYAYIYLSYKYSVKEKLIYAQINGTSFCSSRGPPPTADVRNHLTLGSCIGRETPERILRIPN